MRLISKMRRAVASDADAVAARVPASEQADFQMYKTRMPHQALAVMKPHEFSAGSMI